MFGFFPKFFSTYNIVIGIVIVGILILLYVAIWIWSNFIKKIKFKIDGSEVIIKSGNIFEESDFKVIAFNEYFDTIVDNGIISEKTLNGVFIKKIFGGSIDILDEYIFNNVDKKDIIETDVERKKGGKNVKYRLGTSLVYEDYILTAFSKFDDDNRAVLKMPEYLSFLTTFWDRVNLIYANKSVSVPIFGSGITRIKENKNIPDEDLLKIMLWTFKLSEYRFKYPAKLTIVIHETKIKQFNLFDLKILGKGF